MQAGKAFDDSVPRGKRHKKQSSKKSKNVKTQRIKRWPEGDPMPSDPLGQKLAELFTNSWDWIYAEAPDKTRAIEWKTMKMFPLSPLQMWDYHQNPDCLIGIRPKSQTRWQILDIDKGSPYHPSQDPNGLEKIRDALEDIGICRIQINQSSHSGGLHIYCPLPEPVSSFWLAAATKFALEAIAIPLKSGHCEIFPNPKRYLPRGRGFSNYAAIRLPMQPDSGFVPLDDDLNPLPWTLEDWFTNFELLSDQQDFPRLEEALTEAKATWKVRKNRQPQSIASWEAAIAQEKLEGWTGRGQTNEKLKCFGCEARVFLGLDSVDDVAEHIYQSAINSPGFQEHSRHVRDIRRRSYEVANWAMSYYWPYGSEANRKTSYHGYGDEKIINFSYHQQLKKESQKRIKEAVNRLRESNELSSGISERADQLIFEAKVSRKSLYKSHNLELWHPKFTAEPPEVKQRNTNQQTQEKRTESHIGRGCLPYAKEHRNDVDSNPLKPLINKDCLPAPYDEGFEDHSSSETGATADLPPQGQRSAKVALPADEPSSVQPINGWDAVKAALPARLQAKITQKQRQLALKLEPKQPDIQSKPDKSVSPPVLHVVRKPDEIPKVDREPMPAERKELDDWYQLAQKFGLVTDFRWNSREYFVLAQGKWLPFSELSADFTLQYLQRYFGNEELE